MPFEQNEFMPAPSILEKLEAFDPEIKYDLLRRAAIVTCRRHDEAGELTTIFKRACKRGWDNFLINMMTYNGSYALSSLPPEAFKAQESAREQQKKNITNHFLSGRGDDLRLAILDYMAEKQLTPQALGLDQAEQDSLKLLLPKEAPRDPKAVRETPVIWHMP